MQRMLQHIVQDGALREYFHSGDGSGLGAKEQGWTAAIALALDHELRQHNK